MRVIAGSAGGIRLRLPLHDFFRPTMDLVRGAVFSSLGDRVIDAVVLDLFAGTGAFGIEALSRGAQSSEMVDAHRRAVATIRENLARTRLEARVHQADAFKFLARASGPYDLIFADPPYAKTPDAPDLVQALLLDEHLPRLLREDGILVLERNAEAPPLDPARWQISRSKRYGSTEIVYATHPETA
ncbi:MAG: 16S rRNA (guanine(966)-N(2))-methyltransferase RsmD [Verrucomicrobia bacterium]|nr:16S rRNA (guanine(966)-N(2))-methyltransferase RsmD [Verrucomicrobiota bacterium]